MLISVILRGVEIPVVETRKGELTRTMEGVIALVITFGANVTMPSGSSFPT